jgi:hypothetical protein
MWQQQTPAYIVLCVFLRFVPPQLWTLEKKAGVMQAALARHDRHGLTAECTLPSPGNITDCLNGNGQTDNDNNGQQTRLLRCCFILK